MASLVVGGTSGLGLELAKELRVDGEDVVITGRHDPQAPRLQFEALDLSGDSLSERIGEFVMRLPEVRTLVYAAGYYQEGTMTDLTATQIEDMLNVGGRGLIYCMQAILRKQGRLEELITITSTSQWTPRAREPIYNYVKAGEAMLSNSLAEDGRVGKVLVVAPSGMNTPFWAETERDDTAQMLDPQWVASEVMKLRQDKYSYRFAKVLRGPERVEIAESR